MKKINETRYPPHAPYKPAEPERSRFIDTGAKDGQVLYRDVKVIGDRDDLVLEEIFEDNEEELPKPTLNYNQISLQDIVDAAPPGAKLSDIKLHIYYSRYAEYLDVSFVHRPRDLDAEEQAYRIAMNRYNDQLEKYLADMDKYEKDLAAFEEWRKAEKVKQLEEELAALKK